MSVGSQVTNICLILFASSLASANMFNMQSSRNGLIFQMGFEEGSGTTTVDKSGRGFTGTLTGTSLPVWNASGKNGNSLTFSYAGKNQVRIPHVGSSAFNNPTKFTIMGWVYPTTDPNDGYEHAWFSQQHATGICKTSMVHDYSSCTGQPSFGVYLGGGYQYVCAPSKLTLNTWSHIAGTYNNATGDMKIYVNGSLVASANYTGTLDTCPGPYVIGGNEGPGSAWQEWTQGRLDDIRIYNKVLDAAQINSLKNLRVP